MLGQPVEFHSVTKHHVAAGEHMTQDSTGISTFVFPQILAVVDVEADGHAKFIGNVEGLKGCHGCLW